MLPQFRNGLDCRVAPEAISTNRYFTVRATQGLEPKLGWYLMLLSGVFVGAFLSSWLSGDRSRISVPPLWRWRFADSAIKRFAAALAGGAIMVLGARIAGGCTSGHGISGTLQLAVQSWTFILARRCGTRHFCGGSTCPYRKIRTSVQPTQGLTGIAWRKPKLAGSIYCHLQLARPRTKAHCA